MLFKMYGDGKSSKIPLQYSVRNEKNVNHFLITKVWNFILSIFNDILRFHVAVSTEFRSIYINLCYENENSKESLRARNCVVFSILSCAGIFKQSMGAWN
jgi:hypothetical protein